MWVSTIRPSFVPSLPRWFVCRIEESRRILKKWRNIATKVFILLDESAKCYYSLFSQMPLVTSWQRLNNSNFADVLRPWVQRDYSKGWKGYYFHGHTKERNNVDRITTGFDWHEDETILNIYILLIECEEQVSSSRNCGKNVGSR